MEKTLKSLTFDPLRSWHQKAGKVMKLSLVSTIHLKDIACCSEPVLVPVARRH
jgi:hypothetical protein